MEKYPSIMMVLSLVLGFAPLYGCSNSERTTKRSIEPTQQAVLPNDSDGSNSSVEKSGKDSPAENNQQDPIESSSSRNENFPLPDLSQLSSSNLTLLIVGDSISTGVFADTERGERIADADHSLLEGLYNLIPDITSFILDPKYPSPGDVQTHMTRPHLSYLNSDKPWGIPTLLREATSFPQVDVVNLAAVGASVTKTFEGTFLQGSGQIDWLEQQYAENKLPKKAEVVIYQLGANDFCRGVDPESFQTDAKAQIQKLAAMHPDSTLIVVPIPDIPLIFEAVGTEDLGISVDRQAVIDRWNLSGIVTLAIPDLTRSCKEIQDLFQLCKNPRDSDRLTTMNDSLVAIVAELQSGGSKIGYAEGLTSMEFYGNPSSLVSGDCFHPSESGHEKIAEFLWPDLKDLLESSPSQL